ncbi:MAG: hypothetical protein IKE95_08705 [Methanobrevibacter sp.]|nr:hypothetical protein [Methanobrevibacter sp.]
MKCANCEKDAEYDSLLEYTTKNGLQKIHGCYCEEHMNQLLIYLFSYRKQLEFKLHSVIRLDNEFYKSLPDCYKGKTCHEKG